MTDNIGIFDGITGEQIERPMTAAEAKERAAEIAAYFAAKEAKATAEAEAVAKREAVIAALAAAAGLEVDEVAQALGV